jgi:hypothetical protein
LARKGGEAGERSGLAACKPPEFRELGHQGARRDLPHDFDRGQQIFEIAPSRRAAHTVIDILVDFGQLLLQRLDQSTD